MNKRYWFYNPKAKIIAQSLKENPEDWDYRNELNYSLEFKNTPFVIWVGNGWLFVEIIQPQNEKLGLFGRTHVWWNYLKWKKNRINLNDEIIKDILNK